jgi:hypothetical protein
MAGHLSDLDRGIVCGLLLSQGSFGGDGRQPQVTLRMHVRHETLLRWLVGRFPRSRLYGPYHHADRSYYQWMARGRVLVEDVLPVLEAVVDDDLDPPAAARLRDMVAKYADHVARVRDTPG